MTPRERVRAALNHQMPDRIPISLGWRGEVMEAVQAHYKAGSATEVAKILDADLSRSAGVTTLWPDYDKRVNGELDGPFGGSGRTILRDARTFEDCWGVVERVGENGKYLEWVSGPFVHTGDLDSFGWPKADRIVVPPDLAEKVRALKAQGYWVHGSSGVHPFKQAWRMRGMQNFLCDYIDNPEWVEAFQERILEYCLLVTRPCAAAGVDQFSYWGDVAMQNRMMVSPESWRSLDKRFWKRLIDGTREVNPEVTFFFHSDGNITEILPDLIEVGFDIVNPLQPESVDPARIKRDFGARIALDGGGSVQRMLPFGTVEDVKREVDYLMRCCAYDGGYLFRASNVVSFDCPIENIVAFYETARDYDLSKIDGPPREIPDEPPCRRIAAKHSA